jgi:hypothetical protein
LQQPRRYTPSSNERGSRDRERLMETWVFLFLTFIVAYNERLLKGGQ